MILLALFVPFVWYFYPETSGLSLEEVDNLFLPADQQVRKLSFSTQNGRVVRSDGASSEDDKVGASEVMVEKV